jgi:hypothetical protein
MPGAYGDAVSAPADARVCARTVDQYCAALADAGTNSTQCSQDFSAALQSLIASQEGSGLPCGFSGPPHYVSDCGTYSAIGTNGVDTSSTDYYDKATGKLVAEWNLSPITNPSVPYLSPCAFGPADFVLPSCGPSTSICNMLSDGGCDPSCAGSCDNGRCLDQIPAPVGPSSATEVPNRIATDGVNVYWTSDRAGTIMAAPIEGGAPVVLATGQVGAWGIAVSGGDLYWTRSIPFAVDAGTVQRMPLDGGTPETIASSQANPQDIATDGVRVYWADVNAIGPNGPLPGAIVSAPLDGGAPTTLASGQTQPLGVAVHGGSLYWVTSESLMAVALDGGAPVTLASLPPEPTSPGISMSLELVLDSRDAYWVSDQNASTQGGVFRVPLSGGTFVTLAGTDGAYSVATDGTTVYAASSTNLVRVPVDGGPPATLLTGSWVGPSRGAPMILDATHLFWIGGEGVVMMSPR